MKDFLGWLQANESVLGRTAGQVAGRIANIPGQVAKWAGNEIGDFRNSYAKTRRPIGSQQSTGNQSVVHDRPMRPIGPPQDVSPGPIQRLRRVWHNDTRR